jgi:hypothetical protein
LGCYDSEHKLNPVAVDLITVVGRQDKDVAQARIKYLLEAYKEPESVQQNTTPATVRHTFPERLGRVLVD